jgi:hypothetical protein
MPVMNDGGCMVGLPQFIQNSVATRRCPFFEKYIFEKFEKFKSVFLKISKIFENFLNKTENPSSPYPRALY